MHQRRDPPRTEEAARVSGVREGLHAPHALGATMVSSEGACAAYYAYGRRREADIAAQTPELTSLVQIGGGR